MAVTPRLDLRLSQTLTLTPQLRQAIKMLQMSSLEIADFVAAEIEENPLLEGDSGSDDGDSEFADQRADDADADSDNRDSADFAEADTMPAVADEPLDTDYANLWTDDDTGGTSGLHRLEGSGGRSNGFDNEAPNLEQTISEPRTLRDHLMEQINIDLADPMDRLIGVHLIDMLDESGWLSGEPGTVAALLNCDEGRVLQTLERVQHFDPPGIFARSLGECWALQQRERDRLDPAMQALLDNLDLLARRDFAALKKICGVDDEDLRDMVAEIKALNPRPASAFAHEVVQPIIPDVIMRPLPNGDWRVELNADALPRVLINQRYYAEVSRSARSRSDKSYLSERLQSANWLVKSLHQRANTILKVASEIVRQQDRFFSGGAQHLRPLILRDIATEIEMHESTVSRVTANKFIATPRGIFELKYFFTAALASAGDGDAHSAEAVRFRIKALIDAESPDRVLSDDKIVQILRSKSIDIARRTVAKYRVAMRIPASLQRGREKSINW